MLELQEVSKRYGSLLAVDRLSFSVEAGELLVLMGGSGCGKTTTLKMINRLIEPSNGEIRIEGEDIRRSPSAELRRRIGYCFQNVGLFPHMTVAENVTVTLRLLGWSRDRQRERADELLELVGLDPSEFTNRQPDSLSGGQAQRVGLARSLAASPALMLLDEPFGALDPLTRDRLQRSFQEIRRKLRLTAVFVTHDMTEALLLGNRIAVMNGGRLAQLGRPQDLLQHPADTYVAQLMETPRRQAEKVDALLEPQGPEPDGGSG